MSIRNSRNLLAKQLEQLIEAVLAEQVNTKFVASVATTCFSMMGVVENAMPKDFSQEEFNSIYASYRGILTKVKKFYDTNSGYFREDESVFLNDLLNKLHSAEQNKQELDDKLSKIQAQVEANEKLLQGENEECRTLEVKNTELTSELYNVQERNSCLKAQIDNLNSQIAGFESNLQRLVQEGKAAKDNYEDMVAYYKELERIRKGISQEGFVNIDDFILKTQDMNRQCEDLISKYDGLLRNINSDVEALQEKIEERQGR
ncbi:hypothetical protein J5690_08200 [bacterium]|nr:hypothetical protein [bacterium]